MTRKETVDVDVNLGPGAARLVDLHDRTLADERRAARELARIYELLEVAREDARAAAKDWKARIEAMEYRARDLARAIRSGEYQAGLFDDGPDEK